MTDDERAAREWLKTAACYMHQQDEIGARHRDTILRLLDRPVMPRPEDVPSDVLREMCLAMGIMDSDGIDDMRGAYRVLHAHLTTPPQPKRGVVIAKLRYWLDDDSTPGECKADLKEALALLQEAADDDR